MSKFSRIFTAVTCATAVTASGVIPAFAAEGVASPITLTGTVEGAKCTIAASDADAAKLSEFKNKYVEGIEAGITAAKEKFGLSEENYTKFIGATKDQPAYTEVAKVIKEKDDKLADAEVEKLHAALVAASKLVAAKDQEGFAEGIKSTFTKAAADKSTEVEKIDAAIAAIKADAAAAKTEKLAVIETPLALVPETINAEVISALETCKGDKKDKQSGSSKAKGKLDELSSIIKDKDKSNLGEKLLNYFSSIAAAIGLGKVFEKIVEFFKKIKDSFKA